VAVVAAINLDGIVVGLTLKLGSITSTEFMEHLDRLAIHMQPGPAYLFLDNLPVHHTKAVGRKAMEHGIQLVFNATYSCEYNAIEGLWAHAKHSFAKNLLLMDDLGNTRKIQSLIEQSIMEVPARYLRGRISRSLRFMRTYLKSNDN